MIKRLSEVYNRKSNSYNEIRFILSVLVLFAHSFALLGVPRDFFIVLTDFQLGLGSLAVYCFFVLSGFFMIQSLEANESLYNYTKNRVLRIIPAFWISLGVTAFILVPIIANNIDVFSLKKGSSLYFFINAGTFHFFNYAWSITGAFPDNPKIDAINGSMWTLKHEIALYFILPIILWIMHSKRILLVSFLYILFILSFSNILTSFVLFDIPCCKAWVLSINEYSKFIVLTTYFFYGVVLYKYKEHIIVSNRLIIASIFLSALGVFFGNLKIITLVVLPYLVVIIGAKYDIKYFSKTGDYSYGMYIYAFPVQQILVHFFGKDLNVYILFIVSFFIVLLLSVLSWHFIEKKLLALKLK